MTSETLNVSGMIFLENENQMDTIRIIVALKEILSLKYFFTTRKK